MKRPLVTIICTGVANTASVQAAFERLNCEVTLCNSPSDVAKAQYAVLPGVGTFGACMKQLSDLGLDDALRSRIQQQQPLLAICVGMQVLFESSSESPGITGLGIFPGSITKFPPSEKVPQLGWNQVNPQAGCRYLEPGYAYFANSFRQELIPAECSGAYADYGGSFAAAIEKDCLLACQFHPELSSNYGQLLLNRWMEMNR